MKTYDLEWHGPAYMQMQEMVEQPTDRWMVGRWVEYEDVQIERFFIAIALAGALTMERENQRLMSDHFADQMKYEIDRWCFQ